MFAAAVVEAIDVVEQRLGDLVPICPSVPPDQVCFECFEEGFYSGIVVAITLAIH